MILLLEKNNKITLNFATWLIDELKKQLIAQLNNNQMKRFDSTLEQSFNLEITTGELIMIAANNLKLMETESTFIIKFENIFIDRTPLSSLLNFINFGDINIRGYPIFSNVFDTVRKNLDYYLLKYQMIGVL